MRRTPSTNASVIAVLQLGTCVEIIGANEDRSWLHVRLSDDGEGCDAAHLVHVD